MYAVIYFLFLTLIMSVTYSEHDEDRPPSRPGEADPEKFRYKWNWYYDFSCQGDTLITSEQPGNYGTTAAMRNCDDRGAQAGSSGGNV